MRSTFAIRRSTLVFKNTRNEDLIKEYIRKIENYSKENPKRSKEIERIKEISYSKRFEEDSTEKESLLWLLATYKEMLLNEPTSPLEAIQYAKQVLYAV